MERYDVAIVGAGPAGLTAAIYTARAGFDTLVLRGGESILRRNAHLENVPGFPAGVNPRTFLDMTAAQAERAGAAIVDGHVERVDVADGGFTLAVEDEALAAARVVLASKNDEGPVAHLDVGIVQRGSKTYLETDRGGRTGVDGLYAAGRVAERLHQTVVACGSGAETALALIEDSEVPYYHDWVVPEGYFTGRGREVPPGCVELDAAARREREAASLEVMREWFTEPHPDGPTPHPSQE